MINAFQAAGSGTNLSNSQQQQVIDSLNQVITPNNRQQFKIPDILRVDGAEDRTLTGLSFLQDKFKIQAKSKKFASLSDVQKLIGKQCRKDSQNQAKTQFWFSYLGALTQIHDTYGIKSVNSYHAEFMEEWAEGYDVLAPNAAFHPKLWPVVWAARSNRNSRNNSSRSYSNRNNNGTRQFCKFHNRQVYHSEDDCKLNTSSSKSSK